MPEFYLMYDPNSYSFRIAYEKYDDKQIFLAKRDPDIPIDFKPGKTYFNPLLKKRDALALYLGPEPVSMYSGKPPGRFASKAENARADRGWFELEPQLLEWEDIPSSIREKIYQIPKLTGVLSQLLRSALGLRVPPETQFESGEAWQAWVCAQKMLVKPIVKASFNQLIVQPDRLFFPDKFKKAMLTGVLPEPVIRARVRWCSLKECTTVHRNLFESEEYEITVTKADLNAGITRILAMAESQFGPDWKQFFAGPTGRDTVASSETELQSGPLVHIRIEDESDYQLWHKFADAPVSVQSVLNQVINDEDARGN